MQPHNAFGIDELLDMLRPCLKGFALFVDVVVMAVMDIADALPRMAKALKLDVRRTVETVWRYAECVAILSDGSRAKLSDSWQFVGYAGRHPVESLLFCRNGEYFELHIGAEHLRIVSRDRHYTGIDGSQVSLGV